MRSHELGGIWGEGGHCGRVEVRASGLPRASGRGDGGPPSPPPSLTHGLHPDASQHFLGDASAMASFEEEREGDMLRGGGGGGGLWTEVRGQQTQSNDPSNNQHTLNTPSTGHR